MPFSSSHLVPAAASLALSLALTPLVRAVARKYGVVAKPKADRWHKRPTAMMGGVAIYLAVTVSFLLFVPHTREGWVVMGASTALFFVGLVDDFLHIKPYQKLIGQVFGASAVVYFGLLLPWGWGASVAMVLTIFWLIGITNAINLLDNMDGLAAGVSAIAAVFIAASFADNGQTTEAAMLAVFAAALVGFLVYNTNPASIFAGASGFLAMVVRRFEYHTGIAMVLGFAVALTLVGVFLAGVKVYDEEDVRAAREKPLVSFLVDLSYKRRIFEVLLDVLLVILAYYFSYVLLFGPELSPELWQLFLSTVPVLICLKMG